MASINLQIPDAVMPRVVAALVSYYGYQEVIIDAAGNQVPNPETKGQFAKRMVAETVMRLVRSVEAANAAEAARVAADAAARTDIVIT